ncbi:MAG TPA: hypothetical protein VLO30_00395, partial [Chthoniobacterales bacterium]|nr:hypothetical protein [Chthoniobacterales bacterium]
MILPVDFYARKFENERGATFESTSGFCVSYDSLGAGAFRDSNLSFNFDGTLDGGGELVSGSASFRTDALIQDDSDHGVRRDDQRFRFESFFHGIV